MKHFYTVVGLLFIVSNAGIMFSSVIQTDMPATIRNTLMFGIVGLAGWGLSFGLRLLKS